MDINNYTILEDLIVRSPVLEMNDLVIQFSTSDASDLFNTIKEALLVSSKVLYNQLIKYDSLGEKEKQLIAISLYKYYSRMCSRPTPFGLLSGIYSTQWGSLENLVINKNFKPKISLGGKVLNEIFIELISNSDIYNQILLYKNDTYYQKGGKLSIIQKTYISHSSYPYSLKEFSANKEDAIKEIYDFIENGKYFNDVVSYIVNNGHNSEEAFKFLTHLIEQNLLTTSIDPIPNTSEYLKLLNNHLQGNSINCIKKVRIIYNKINDFNKSERIDNEALRSLEDYLEQSFPRLINENNLIRVDLNGVNRPEKVPQKYIKCIFDAFKILNKIGTETLHIQLENFKFNFNNKYEENFVPILEVFDPLNGIKYLRDIKTVDTPLLNENIFEDTSSGVQFNLSKNESTLLQLFYSAIRENRGEILLNDKLFDNVFDRYEFSDSFQAWFNIIDDKTIRIINFKGNGSFLLSRFTDNPKIQKIQKSIVSKENELHKEKILAEIIHIPEDIRTFSITNNAKIRESIIPIVSNSYYFKNKNVINLNDIQITVRENKILLFSKKHNMEVIPKITNAVFPANVSKLPIFRFLADLSHYDNKSLSFKWPNLLNHLNLDFIPRVKYKNVILSPATWTLKRVNFNFDRGVESFREDLKRERIKKNIVQFVSLIDGDKSLFLNLENYQTVFSILKKEFNIKEILQIEEYLYDVNFKKENEIIAFFTKKVTEGTLKNSLKKIDLEQKEYFSPISEWINYQIYSSEENIEKILSGSVLQDVIKNLINERYIQKWFFVRYVDEDGFHLRIRFNILNPIENTGIVLSKMSNYFDIIEITDYKMVPYKREINRYKGKNIIYSEELFFHQSNLIIQLLKFLDSKHDENLRWIIGVKLVDIQLNQFDLTLKEKVIISDSLKNEFNREFNIKKKGFKDFNHKYEENKKDIESFMSTSFIKEIEEPILHYIENSTELIIKISNNLSKKDKSEILKSFIHMMLNKLFVILPRQHEVYVYNIINRYYKEKLYLNR